MPDLTDNYPPGPRKFSLRDYLAMQRSMPEFGVSLAREYGDIVYIRIWRSNGLYLLNHPRDIRDVLVTNHDHFEGGRSKKALRVLLGRGLFVSEGDFHREQRRLVQSAFGSFSTTTITKIILYYTEHVTRGWREGQVVNLFEEMTRITHAVIAKILLDVDIEGKDSELGGLLKEPLAIYQKYATFPFIEVLSHFPLPDLETMLKLPLPRNIRFRRARSQMDKALFQIINQRRETMRVHNDVLSALVSSEHTNQMSTTQIRDEIMSLFIAGSETVATTLTWACFLLSSHPEIEDRLRLELSQVLEDRLPTAECLDNLEYTKRIMAETLRLYPPGPALGRRTIDEYKIGPYTLPIGARVILSPYIVHHDPRFYPQPYVFDPDRFLSEAVAKRPKYSFFPFGGGPRHCLGENFAWKEATLILATLFQSWHFSLIQDRSPETTSLIVLRPKSGLNMFLEAHQPVE